VLFSSCDCICLTQTPTQSFSCLSLLNHQQSRNSMPTEAPLILTRANECTAKYKNYEECTSITSLGFEGSPTDVFLLSTGSFTCKYPSYQAALLAIASRDNFLVFGNCKRASSELKFVCLRTVIGKRSTSTKRGRKLSEV